MLYNKSSEFIVATSDNGVAKGKMVDNGVKDHFMSTIVGRIKNYREDHESNLHFQESGINGMNTPFVRCPLTLNMIAAAGYKNVLFVGYYDQGRMLNWLVPTEDVNERVQYENRNVEKVMKPEISFQFLPIFHKEYGYEFNLTVARPPESRHKGCIHHLYDQWEIPYLDTNKQYKHGTSSWTMDNPAVNFDAVVLGHVPKKYDSTTFTTANIRQNFQPYCLGPQVPIIDLFYNYGQDDPLRYTDRNNCKNPEPLVQKAFSTRAEWDQEVVTGREVQFSAWENLIKWY